MTAHVTVAIMTDADADGHWNAGHGEDHGTRGTLLAPRAGDIGGMGRLLKEVPEDLPRRNHKLVTPEVIPADVHQPDESELLAARNRKCAGKPVAVELLVVLLAGDLLPVLPIRRRFDEPRFQLIWSCPPQLSGAIQSSHRRVNKPYPSLQTSPHSCSRSHSSILFVMFMFVFRCNFAFIFMFTFAFFFLL
jgi:hypothetical protein